jgi:hypothetical protein
VITLSELLIESAPNESIRALVNRDDFWRTRSLYGPSTESGPGLLNQLDSFYRLRDQPSFHETLLGLGLNAMAYLFAERFDSKDNPDSRTKDQSTKEDL